MYIPIGDDNLLSGSGSFYGANQPEVFNAGGGSWSAGFDGTKLIWTVSSFKHNGHKTSVASNASSTSNKCSKSEEWEEEEEMLSGLKAYPNPVYEKLKIETGIEWASGAEVYVYDMFGKMYDLKSVSGDNNLIEINMAGLEAGIYIIKLQGESHTEIIRVVKN
jgi:hypothetical protein